jgi:8-oxo-dGTP pyrophosphatase MutT (NUDIX family)
LEGLWQNGIFDVNLLLRAVAGRETGKNDADIKPRKQVAALPYARVKGVIMFMLVTSRETGRPVLPKGWTEKSLTDAEAAEREAFEEAGIKGKIAKKPIGHYDYVKIIGPGFALPCTVAVYPLEIRKHLKSWPEMEERERLWLTAEEAANRVAEPELAEILRNFIPAN